MKSNESEGAASFLSIESGLLGRALVFIAGLFIMAVGVDLSVKANLGVSPISSVPYVLSLRFPLTLGQTTIIFSMLLVGLQILLLRSAFEWFQLIQVPVGLLFGWFIDLVFPLVARIAPTHYAAQAFYCLLSCAVLALGVLLEVKAELTYLPGEGLALAVCRRFGLEFGKSKIRVDCALVALGLVSSLILLGNIQGIREGTLVAATLVGCLVRLYSRALSSFSAGPSAASSQAFPQAAELDVAIAGEFSAGREDGGLIEE